MPVVTPEKRREMYNTACDTGFAYRAIDVASSSTMLAVLGVSVRPSPMRSSSSREMPAHPQVSHGGSGSTIEEIHETLDYGVVKMNTDTNNQYAYTRPIVDHVMADYRGALKMDGGVGDKETHDPGSYLRKAEQVMTGSVMNTRVQLKSAGQTLD